MESWMHGSAGLLENLRDLKRSGQPAIAHSIRHKVSRLSTCTQTRRRTMRLEHLAENKRETRLKRVTQRDGVARADPMAAGCLPSSSAKVTKKISPSP